MGSIIPQAVTLSDAVVHQPLVISLGLAAVLLLALNTLVYLRRYDRQSPDGLAIFTLTFGLFLLISAALVSAGRFRFGFDHAYTEHYNILRVIFWANLLFSIPACWNTTRAWRVFAALALAATIVLCTEIPSRIDGLRYRAAALNNAASAIAAGVYDMGPWRAVNQWNETDPTVYNFMQSLVDSLRQNNRSIFNDAPSAWMGRNIHDLPTTAATIGGAITQTQSHTDVLGPFETVSGWTTQPLATSKQPEIVLTDPTGKIIGFASCYVMPTAPTLWSGYARSNIAPTTAYLFTNGTLSPLTTPSNK